MKREFVVHEIYINKEEDRQKAAMELWRRERRARSGEECVLCDAPSIAD